MPAVRPPSTGLGLVVPERQIRGFEVSLAATLGSWELMPEHKVVRYVAARGWDGALMLGRFCYFGVFDLDLCWVSSELLSYMPA